MGENVNFGAFDQAVENFFGDISSEDADFLFMNNLLNEPDAKAMKDWKELNHDFQLADRDIEGWEDRRTTPEATNSRTRLIEFGSPVPYPDQSAFQNEAKPEREAQIQTEEAFKHAEKALSQQEKDQQNLTSTIEDQRSTKSTNTFSSGGQVTKDLDFTKGVPTCAHLCVNRAEKGENQISHHAQVENDKGNEFLLPGECLVGDQNGSADHYTTLAFDQNTVDVFGEEEEEKETQGLLSKSKKIRRDTRKPTNPKPQKNKKSKNYLFPPQTLETADLLTSSGPRYQEIKLKQQDQIEIEEEKESNQTENPISSVDNGFQISTENSTFGGNARDGQLSEEEIRFPVFNQQSENTPAQVEENIQSPIDIPAIALAFGGVFCLDDLSVLAQDYENVKNYIIFQNLNRHDFADNDNNDAKNSSPYRNRIQQITMKVSNVFNIKKDSRFHAFKVRFYEECQNQQLSPIAFEHYLIIKRLKMLLPFEWERLGLNKNDTQDNLFHMKHSYLQYGIDEKILQAYWRFKDFKRVLKERCQQNGFDKELFDGYLTYELFIKSFRVKCQELSIRPEFIEEYFADQVHGAKNQVPQVIEGEANPHLQKGYGVKITTKADRRKFLHQDPSDGPLLKQKKTGARLAFDIFFQEKFYERSIKKEDWSEDVKKYFIKKKSDLYREFLPGN